MKISLLGLGAWGRNILRSLLGLGVELSYVCDTDEGALGRTLSTYGFLRGTNDPIKAISEADAVIIATPPATHHPLGMEALGRDKHVLIEKPLATNYRQAHELVQEARSRGLVLMTGHVLLYHPAIRALGEMVGRGELGQILYIYSQRTNLGVVRREENVLWSLAPHDIYTAAHLFGRRPRPLWCFGRDYLQPGIWDVAFGLLDFGDGGFTHFHVSWLAPRKVRRMVVVGSDAMAVFDDLEEEEKLKIYERGVNWEEVQGQFHVRYGEIRSPRVPRAEPLALELRDFVESVREGREPLASGEDGLMVVGVLEQLEGLTGG